MQTPSGSNTASSRSDDRCDVSRAVAVGTSWRQPNADLRDGREAIYESLARKDEKMTTAAMVTYAYDQIDQARTEVTQAAESLER